MKQKIEDLNPDDIRRVEAQRKWAREHYTPEAQAEYETIEGKLRLLDCVLTSKWIAPDQTYELQCLGIAFGDVLAQYLGLKWMAVEDELGRTPSLVLEGTSVKLFPLTMISKRIERGEEVDVYELLRGICELFEKMKKECA